MDGPTGASARQSDAAASDAAPAIGRTAIVDRYRAVRAATLALAAGLSPEDAQIQSMPDASPAKWHLAHTAWFFETFLLQPLAPGYKAFDPAFGYLFNSYYEAVGPRHARPQRGLITRPSLDQVRAYRAHVDAAMAMLIEALDVESWAKAAPLIELGLNHEQQHQELILMDIKHAFSCNPLEPAYQDRRFAPTGPAATLGWVAFDGGLRRIGHEETGFAFDNEGPRHKVWLEPFALADRPTTAGDYLAFIADGGYQRPEFWLSDGWGAVQRNGWTAPLYWREDEGDGWSVFTLSGRRPLHAAEPVCHVSFYEADAFAHWAGARLPTEAEWEVAAEGQRTAEGEHFGFVEDGALHPGPASAEEPGLRQMLGHTWEWTSSAYLSYPGFRPAAGAVGEYNGKFMSGQMVLRGGACVTPRDHLRPTYRNFFPPEARWAFSGIRLARDA